MTTVVKAEEPAPGPGVQPPAPAAAAPEADPMAAIHRRHMQPAAPTISPAEMALGQEINACIQEKVGLRAALIRAQQGASVVKATE